MVDTCDARTVAVLNYDPGWAAKPTIDIQVSVPDLEAADTYRPQIESLGWLLHTSKPSHRSFRPPDGQPRVVHVHVCTTGGRYEWSHLPNCDFLRSHPDRALVYGDLKRSLAGQPGIQRHEYTKAKKPFILQIKGEAEAWAATTGWTADL